MKQKFKHLACLLALGMVLAMLAPVAAFAAETAYTYTVTLAMGRQGSYTGDGIQVEGSAYQLAENNGIVTISGLQKGARLSFDQSAAIVDPNGKYYVRGVRISGLDNNTASAPSFLVNADADYVMAYGIKGDLTQYTVNYQDADGNALAPSRSYYGNVGDKPVIAYLYIDGYQPQSYNLTKTLVANSAENAFTFVYTRIANSNDDNDGNGGNDDNSAGGDNSGNNGNGTNDNNAGHDSNGGNDTNDNNGGNDNNNDDNGSGNTPEDVIIYVTPAPVPGSGNGTGTAVRPGTTARPGATVRPGTTALPTGSPNAADQNENADGANDENAVADGENDVPTEEIVQEVPGDANADGASGNGTGGTDANGNSNGDGTGSPEELTDIDANQTPLANLMRQIAETVSNASPVALAGGGVVVAGLIGLFIFLLFARKKKKDEDDNSDEQSRK